MRKLGRLKPVENSILSTNGLNSFRDLQLNSNCDDPGKEFAYRAYSVKNSSFGEC